MAAALMAVSPARGQTASQITPQSFAPPYQQPGQAVVIPEDLGSTVPKGADELNVTLSDVVLEGGTVAPDALAALKAKLVGRTVKLSEVFAAAHALEVAEARDGRVLTRVVVPAQELEEGATLRLVIVRGFIERIDTSAVPQRLADRMAIILAPLLNDPDVTIAQIERKLMLLSDMPGVALTSTLAPGEAFGAAVLVIEADHAPVNAFVTVNNLLSDALGRDAFGLGLDINTPLGQGEQFYFRANGLPTLGRQTSFLDPTPRNRTLAAGMVLPLGRDGLMFNAEATDARTAPRHSASQPGFGSRFRRYSLRLRYPLIRTRALTVRSEASFDMQNERTSIISPVDLPLSLDRLRVARVAGELLSYLPDGGVLSGRVQSSFGINGLGARAASDASATLPLSRQGADADFQKLDVQASWSQPITGPFEIGLQGRAQTSFGQAMSNAEQLGIASSDAISPLSSGRLQGDHGYVARTELRVRVPLRADPLFVTLAPYAFGAVGHVAYAQPTALERRSTNAAAWGAGLRFYGLVAPSRSGLSATFEYGTADVAGLASRPSRFSFNLIAQF